MNQQLRTNNNDAQIYGFPSQETATRQIYMDYNGSAPCGERVIAAMTPFLSTGYGNPSSGHWAADPATQAIQQAREAVAELIGARSREIVFTSGGTEANNFALKGIWNSPTGRGSHLVTSAIEHDAILRVMRYLKTQGARLTVLPVDNNGQVDPDRVAHAIGEDTALVSIMHANNETGVIQPIDRISKITRENGIPLHTDAAQSVGKIPVDINALGVDLLSLAGHKFGAPNGIGALYIRSGTKLTPLFHGAGHEGGKRAGTESALLAAGIGEAARIAKEGNYETVRALRDFFWAQLIYEFGDRVHLNGHVHQRVPNTLNVSFPGHIGADILAKMPHVAATTGSACHAGCVNMSAVLIAMGASVDVGVGTIRFSLGKSNTMEDVIDVIACLKRILG